MHRNVFTSADYSTETLDFLKDSFLTGNKNEGYRYFTKENIEIDTENRTLTIIEDEEQKNLGAEDYYKRGKIDGEFLVNPIFEQFKKGFDFENKIFDGTIKAEDFEKTKKYKPEIGGKIAFTINKIFLDTDGEPYIRMPLANPDINYSFKAKSEGSLVQVGNTKIEIKNVLENIGNQDLSKLKILQKNNSREKILQKHKINHSEQLGNWTVKIFDKQSGKYEKTEFRNCYISRAYDGAFEIMKTDIYKSYEKLEDNLDVNEEIGYDRVNTIIKLSDLTKFISGNIEVKKVFYKNKLVNIENLPEDFRKKFTNKDGKTFIQDFEMTPPLAMFIKQVNRNFLNPVLANIRKEHKKSVDGLLKTKNGLKSEDEFGKKYNLTKSIERKEKLNFNNYEEIINKSNFSEDEKEKLKKYILNLKNKNQDFILLNPDFEIKSPSGKTILIEYKTSKKANTINKNQKLNIKLFMLFGDSKNIENYNTIIGNNYGVDYQDIGHGIKTYSEKFLDEKGVKTKEDLQDFLS